MKCVHRFLGPLTTVNIPLYLPFEKSVPTVAYHFEKSMTNSLFYPKQKLPTVF